jgi:hypothetical protein
VKKENARVRENRFGLVDPPGQIGVAHPDEEQESSIRRWIDLLYGTRIQSGERGDHQQDARRDGTGRHNRDNQYRPFASCARQLANSPSHGRIHGRWRRLREKLTNRMIDLAVQEIVAYCGSIRNRRGLPHSIQRFHDTPECGEWPRRRNFSRSSRLASEIRHLSVPVGTSRMSEISS